MSLIKSTLPQPSQPKQEKAFKENSLIKAKYFSKKSNMICLADDSGLEIDILNKKPGIFSSRWGGSKGNFNIAMNKVFKELDKKDQNWKNKKIRYTKGSSIRQSRFFKF